MEQPLLSFVGERVGARLFLVLWGGMALASVSAGPAGVRPALVLALVGACALGLRALGVLAVAGVGWLVLDGFVAHSYGDLAFTGSDLLLVPLVLLVAVPALLGVRR